jgi:hypothetical protein
VTQPFEFLNLLAFHTAFTGFMGLQISLKLIIFRVLKLIHVHEVRMVFWTGRICIKPWTKSHFVPIRTAAMATSNNAIPSAQQAINFLNIIEKLKVIFNFHD